MFVLLSKPEPNDVEHESVVNTATKVSIGWGSV